MQIQNFEDEIELNRDENGKVKLGRVLAEMIGCEKITQLWAIATEMRTWFGPYKQIITDEVKAEFIEKKQYIVVEGVCTPEVGELIA
jgi:hypothetical protein